MASPAAAGSLKDLAKALWSWHWWQTPTASPLQKPLDGSGWQSESFVTSWPLAARLLPADPVCAHTHHPMPAKASQLELYLLQWVWIFFWCWVYPANLNYLYFELFSILVISFSAFSTYSILYNTAININIYIYRIGLPRVVPTMCCRNISLNMKYIWLFYMLWVWYFGTFFFLCILLC